MVVQWLVQVPESRLLNDGQVCETGCVCVCVFNQEEVGHVCPGFVLVCSVRL